MFFLKNTECIRLKMKNFFKITERTPNIITLNAKKVLMLSSVLCSVLDFSVALSNYAKILVVHTSTTVH